MKPLRLGGVIDQPQFHRVGLVRLKTRKLHHVGRRLKDAVRANSVELIFLGNWVAFVGFVFREQASLEFNLSLSIWRLGIGVCPAPVVLAVDPLIEALIRLGPLRLQ